MKAEKIIRLRIQNSTFCRRIRVVQGDTGRIFRFILEDITMDGSEQARVYAKKSDGTEVYNDCEVVSTNEVLMESDSGQIFAAIGVVQAEIQISKSGKTITTYTFEFDVEISLTRAGAIQSSSEYGALEAAIAKAEGFYNPTFAEAKTRDNINSGESIPTLFGKVKKWFTDLNTLIKLVGSTDISGIGNGTVTDALSVLNSNRTMTIEIKGSGNATEIIKNNWDNLPVNIPLDLYLRTSTVYCTAHGYRYGKYGMFEILSIDRSMCGWLHRYLDEYTFYANSMIK